MVRRSPSGSLRCFGEGDEEEDAAAASECCCRCRRWSIVVDVIAIDVDFTDVDEIDGNAARAEKHELDEKFLLKNNDVPILSDKETETPPGADDEETEKLADELASAPLERRTASATRQRAIDRAPRAALLPLLIFARLVGDRTESTIENTQRMKSKAERQMTVLPSRVRVSKECEVFFFFSLFFRSALSE